MKHWRPDTDGAGAVPLHRANRRRRDWASLDSYAPPRPKPRANELRPAIWAGLGMVAALCLVAGIGAHKLLGKAKPVDRLAVETRMR